MEMKNKKENIILLQEWMVTLLESSSFLNKIPTIRNMNHATLNCGKMSDMMHQMSLTLHKMKRSIISMLERGCNM